MKVRNLVDMVIASAKQVDEQNTFGYNRVKMALSLACNDVMFRVFKMDASNYDLYVKPYDVDIDRTIAFRPSCEIPTKIVQLQFMGDGVRQILPINSGYMMFAAMSLDLLSLYHDTPLNELDDTIPYALENNRIIFSSSLPVDVKKVRLMLVRPLEAYDDNEEFYIPSGQDMSIVTRTLQLLGVRQPANLTNSNTEWQQVQQPQPSQE